MFPRQLNLSSLSHSHRGRRKPSVDTIRSKKRPRLGTMMIMVILIKGKSEQVMTMTTITSAA